MEGFPFTPDQFNPELIHRILLTDEEDFPNLTFSGQPQNEMDRTPLSFTTFAVTHGIRTKSNSPSPQSSSENSSRPPVSIAEQIGNTMRRAYFDQISDAITKNEDFQPFHNMLMELYTSIRKLVPRRRDLHSFLNDESIQEPNLKENFKKSAKSILSPIITAGEAITQLEAPDQSSATSDWMKMATDYSQNSSSNTFSSNASITNTLDIDELKFAILSTAYLLNKANFCQMDIQNVHLRQFLAPKLTMNNSAMGILWERYYFQKQYGQVNTSSFSNASGEEKQTGNENKSIPHTRAWVEQIISTSPNFMSSSKIQRIELLLQKGIVQSILFSASQKPTSLPEVLKLDAKSLSNIRRVAQLSVTGSALALHCCIAGGIVSLTGEGGDLRKSHELLSLDSIKKERSLLTKAMAKGRGPDGNEMTDDLEEAILKLANELSLIDSSCTKSSFEESKKDDLLHRGKGVLCGTDPVFKLLDKRIRLFFATMITWNPSQSSLLDDFNVSTSTPIMRTGHANHKAKPNLPSSSQNVQNEKKTNFLKQAKDKARATGFSIYANDLANASWTLKRLGDHMISVNWDVCLKRIIEENG